MCMINGVIMNWNKKIYLDYAASTPLIDEVKKKIIDTLGTYGNPSSQHVAGFEAKAVLDEASEIISQKLNCNPEELYYTSGATMSNNLAIQGFLKSTNGLLITSQMEHDDILLIAENYPRVMYINCTHDGFVETEHLISILQMLQDAQYDRPILVSIQYANSETGVIQDIPKISRIVHSYSNCYLHTDATQYIAHYDVDVQYNNIDMLSMSGQKIGCIKGTGLLYVKEGTPISSIIYGDQGLIGGTENVLGIACLGEAFKWKHPSADNLIEKRKYMLEKINGKLVGDLQNRIPNNLLILFEGVSSELMVEMLNEHGICVSGGSACSSTNGKPSNTLLAMGYSEKDASDCVRFTLPASITYEEINYVCDCVNECYAMLGGEA